MLTLTLTPPITILISCHMSRSNLQFKNYENVSGKYDVMMYSYSNNRLASIMQGSVHRNNLGLVVVLK